MLKATNFSGFRKHFSSVRWRQNCNFSKIYILFVFLLIVCLQMLLKLIRYKFICVYIPEWAIFDLKDHDASPCPETRAIAHVRVHTRAKSPALAKNSRANKMLPTVQLHVPNWNFTVPTAAGDSHRLLS